MHAAADWFFNLVQIQKLLDEWIEDQVTRIEENKYASAPLTSLPGIPLPWHASQRHGSACIGLLASCPAKLSHVLLSIVCPAAARAC
jgi:hypothetical protein